MSKKTEPIPGMSDILPDEVGAWQFLEDTARYIFGQYGYGEIRAPVLERTDVFLRTIGDQTDIVQKEMYTFEDRGGRRLTLRPEGTAGVLRALANNGIAQGDERRVFYSGPMFRGERPAAGRKRQFHQIGAECVGKVAAGIDAECIAMLMHYLEAIDITNVELLINSRGTAEDREAVAGVFRDYFAKVRDELCADCQRRLETNVWRILDCKNDACRDHIAGAPSMISLFSEPSQRYFNSVCRYLDTFGITYTIDSRLVRGLDYYAHTVFEITHSGIGAQSAIAGGGRYEMHFPGSKQALVGIGFATGVERLLMTRGGDADALGVPSPDAYLISLGDTALNANLVLANSLRRKGFRIAMDLEGRGAKAQMRAANKSGAPLALIRGEAEMGRGVVTLKEMADSTQREVCENEIEQQLTRTT